MELELKKLYDTVTSIHEEMFYLRGRQEKHFYSLKQFNETKLYIYINYRAQIYLPFSS